MLPRESEAPSARGKRGAKGVVSADRPLDLPHAIRGAEIIPLIDLKRTADRSEERKRRDREVRREGALLTPDRERAPLLKEDTARLLRYPLLTAQVISKVITGEGL